jgi:uncharacterized heparinase superfamily protein
METMLPLPRSRGTPVPSQTPAKVAGSLQAVRERIGLAALTADSVGRAALARMRRSPLLRWRHRAPIAHELVLAPPDLRPVDPSFADEVASGSMGLAGLTVALDAASPFAVAAPSAAWARELNGFGWLRHFAAQRTLDSDALAQRLIADWLDGARRPVGHAWEPDVAGRRMISWLSHAGLLLDGADRRTRSAVMLSLERQAGYLSASWRDAPDGCPRLIALIGLVQACLCIGGHERRLVDAERHLVRELDRQILADGGHASRNPRAALALLLDLLPLRQCFGARAFAPPDALVAAVDRAMPMLRHLRLGDGELARFNGMGAGEQEALAMVLAYDRRAVAPPVPVSPSGYVRLERGVTAIVVDAGPAPPLELAGEACAGCLSFELSTGPDLLLVNGGMPALAHARTRAAARASASHNTLVVGGRSSAELVRSAGLRRRLGASPIRRPDHVTAEVREGDRAIMLCASHDGYAGRFGLVHTRILTLDASGTCLDGEDTLEGARGDMRFAWDVPVAVHFHLHPQAGARYIAADGTAELILPSGERWRLSAAGAALSIEQSTHFADAIGPLQAQQVVLRTACSGTTRIRWRLERIAAT